MTRQRLADAVSAGGVSGGGAGPMKPGDTRTIHANDKDGTVIKTITIHRTERLYAEDLCDAYNVAMSDDARRRGLAWYVTSAGEVKLGDSEDFTRWKTERSAQRRERERQDWKRAQHRAEREDA